MELVDDLPQNQEFIIAIKPTMLSTAFQHYMYQLSKSDTSDTPLFLKVWGNVQFFFYQGVIRDPLWSF